MKALGLAVGATCAIGLSATTACGSRTLLLFLSDASPGISESADSGSDGGCASQTGSIVLASGQNQPWGIAIDSTSVYWTNRGTLVNSYADGTVMRVSLCGGTPTTIASAQGDPQALAVDATHVYWTNAFGQVVKAVLAGGEPTTLVGGWGTTLVSMAVDTESVYWTTADYYPGPIGGVFKVPLGGGAPTTLASGSSPARGIAVDRTHVYWGQSGQSNSLMSIPLAGGTPTSLASSSIGGIVALALDATNVYWAANANGPGSVGKVPLGGGAPVLLGTGIPQGGIAVDSANVYWAGQGAVWFAPIAGGEAQTLAAGTLGQPTPYGVAVDATSVYWTVPDLGTVMKLTPK